MQRALDIQEAASGADSVPVAMVLINQAYLALMQQRLSDAEAALERALAIAQTRLGDDDPMVGDTRDKLEQVRQLQRDASAH